MTSRCWACRISGFDSNSRATAGEKAYSEPLAQDQEGVDFQLTGLISLDLVKPLLPNNHFQFYLCGPSPFMKAISAGLIEWQVPESRIFSEAFGPASVKRAKTSSDDESAASVRVQFRSTQESICWDNQSESLLELAEAIGIVVDSGCRAGSCGTCQTAVLRGRVQYPDGMQELRRRPKAKEICNNLGLRSAKRSDVCIDCHYTTQEIGGRAKPVSGVSCESCHGSAKDWLTIHNDYGGPTASKENETDDHRQQRFALSVENGMKNTRNFYLIARSCYGCHTVPKEELVNVGGHHAGSMDFELVAWSQGQVRHNFLRTDGLENGVSEIERLRVMYVVGLIANLEFSTRATAKATSKSAYGVNVANRSARAGSKSRLLEIRWQGFRELLKQHVAMRQHVDKLYRENSLRTHLREINSLKKLPKEVIEQIANETVFESFGEFQWNHNFNSISKKDISERILSEPLIAEQGDYVNGLILIRNGFARLSRKHGDGHQTIAYLGKGDVFGLRELVHNWRNGEQTPWLLSLRAVGYVDVLRIPTDVCERLVLSNIPESVMPPPLPENIPRSEMTNRRKGQRKDTVDRGLMEFLVEKRFINGTQTMMIDLNRCTRCDDCVRACASTHNNNPRFQFVKAKNTITG